MKYYVLKRCAEASVSSSSLICSPRSHCCPRPIPLNTWAFGQNAKLQTLTHIEQWTSIVYSSPSLSYLSIARTLQLYKNGCADLFCGRTSPVEQFKAPRFLLLSSKFTSFNVPAFLTLRHGMNLEKTNRDLRKKQGRFLLNHSIKSFSCENQTLCCTVHHLPLCLSRLFTMLQNFWPVVFILIRGPVCTRSPRGPLQLAWSGKAGAKIETSNRRKKKRIMGSSRGGERKTKSER